MARTTVIAGTATAVSGNVASRQAAQARQQSEVAALQEQQRAAAQQTAIDAAVAQRVAPQPAGSSAQPAGEDLLTTLERLGELKQQGLLIDDEFAAAKAKLLS